MFKKITINNKKYNLKVALTNKDKRIGLSNLKSIKRNQGMLFCYNALQKGRSFTMEKTNFDLLIIFLDNDFSEVYREKGKAKSKKRIQCNQPSQYVIEIPV